MKIQATRTEDGARIMFKGISKMSRIRTDLKTASKRAGWLAWDKQGTLYIFDDMYRIVYIEEE